MRIRPKPIRDSPLENDPLVRFVCRVAVVRDERGAKNGNRETYTKNYQDFAFQKPPRFPCLPCRQTAGWQREHSLCLEVGSERIFTNWMPF